MESAVKDSIAKNLPKAVEGLKNFEYFCKEILGYREDKSIGYFNLTPTHTELCTKLQNLSRSLMVLMPRYSIKSHIVTIGYTLWRLAKEPNLRILIYSDTATKAQGFLSGIKSHIEGKSPNSIFREVYGAWESDPHRGGTYNESKVTVTVRQYDLKEPSIDTGSIDASKVGLHYDLIIFDDIVSDTNVTTKAQMDKIHDCYKKSLSLLVPNHPVIMVGTRWSYGDSYGRIIDENKEKNNFEIFIKDAEELVDGKLIFESIGLDRAFLDYQRKEQGSYIYSVLYRNSPASEETAVFKSKDFQFYKPYPDFHKNFFISGSCDPAGEGEDFTAITVVGTDANKNMYVLDAVNKKMSPSQIIEEIIMLNYKWGFDRFGCERNFFKGMLEKAFREAEVEHNKQASYKQFSFKEDLIATSKQRTFTRILGLQPIHERGQLFFPGTSLNSLGTTMGELAFQMLQFTVDGAKSPHDDLLVSLAFHVEMAVAGGSAPTEELNRYSVAYLEREFVNKHNQMQRRLPRHRRQFLTRSLS